MRILDGYPTSWGSQRAAVFPHKGPVSYTQLTIAAATAIVGGDSVIAQAEAGFRYFDWLSDGMTDDGVFRVVAIPNGPSDAIQGAPCKTYTLMWIANKTGVFGGQAQVINTEVAATTDLSAFVLRLLGVGPK